jgi:hypothetical protein
MKLVGVMSTAVLSFTLAVAAPAFALQEQHDQQEEQKAKPAEQGEKKAQPEKPAKQEQKPAAQERKASAPQQKPSAQQEKKTKPEEKNTRQPVKNAKPEQKSAQQQHAQPAPSKQPQHAANRIPDDRFKANFGQQHRFRVSQADYSRDRHFQYGGYSFGFVDPWPSNWLYTQDVYVVEINGIYYLCNPAYPGVNIALTVNL